MNCHFDYAVIGAGMAGSSIAAHLADGASVVMLEAEDQPSYHSTGRSAAVLADFYGNSLIQAVTRASRSFFYHPPETFSGSGLVRPRPMLMVASKGQEGSLASFIAALPDGCAEEVSSDRAVQLCPVLRRNGLAGAVLVTTTADIEVHELQQGYLRQFRAKGGVTSHAARVSGMSREDGKWKITAGSDEIRCSVVINAAGAWADEIGVMAGAQPIGLRSFRRTAILIDAPEDAKVSEWPMVCDVDEAFYLKPDAGMLLLSPGDEGSSEPCDAQPEDLDVAIAVDRIEQATTLVVKRVAHRWAGLRSFVKDRSPVVGYDGLVPNFFWIAALGGYGIQTAPELSRVAAALARGSVPETVGYDPLDMSPLRLSAR